MLRRTEMIALPIKRKLLHKCCVIYTPNTGHTVMGNIPYDEIMKIAEGIR